MGFEGAEDVASGSGVGGGGVAGVAGNNRQQQELEMRYERNRLSTFDGSWPADAPVEARKVAKGGFFRDGSSSSRTEVRCPWCSCTVDGWDYGDQVMARHRRASPDCPFIKNASDNVPLIGGGAATEGSSSGSRTAQESQNESRIPSSSSAGEDGGGGGGPTSDSVDGPGPGDPMSVDRQLPAPPPLPPSSSGVVTEEDVVGMDVGPSQRPGSSISHAEIHPVDDGPSPAPRPSAPRPRPSVRDPAASFSPSDLRRESVRLRTFQRWPLAFVTPGQLAAVGFVYTGSRDCVRCVFCGEYVAEWDQEDDPAVEHRNLFPHCPLMRGDDCGNVTLEDEEAEEELGEEGAEERRRRRWEDRAAREDRERRARESASASAQPSSSVSPPPALMSPPSQHQARSPPPGFSASAMAAAGGPMEVASEDETGIRPRRRDANSGPERPLGVRWSTYGGSGRDGEPPTGIIRHTGPAHPKYSTTEARMRTFSDWPPALRQQPKELAESGFFYVGRSDQVKCFSCDGGLRNWQPEDHPWTEHARWFSKCNFVRLVKGDEFIAEALADKPPENTLNSMEDDDEQQQPSSSQSSSSSSGGEEDEETRLRRLMSSAVVQQALALGLDHSRVKMALRRRLRTAGAPFETSRQLIDAAFAFQNEQEERAGVENNSSPAAFSRGASTPALLREQPGHQRREAAREPSGPQSMEVEPSSSFRNPPNESQLSTPSSSSAVGGGMARSTSDPSSVHLPSPPLSKSEPATPAGKGGDPREEADKKKAATMPHSSTVVDQEISASLEQENRRLKEQRICKVCMDNEIGVVFVPCGHLCCCVQCAPALKDCPVCRQPIHGTVKAYLS